VRKLTGPRSGVKPAVEALGLHRDRRNIAGPNTNGRLDAS
jgi:hypothetical protein